MPSQSDVEKALAQLKRELESPAFQKAFQQINEQQEWASPAFRQAASAKISRQLLDADLVCERVRALPGQRGRFDLRFDPGLLALMFKTQVNVPAMIVAAVPGSRVYHIRNWWSSRHNRSVCNILIEVSYE